VMLRWYGCLVRLFIPFRWALLDSVWWWFWCVALSAVLVDGEATIFIWCLCWLFLWHSMETVHVHIVDWSFYVLRGEDIPMYLSVLQIICSLRWISRPCDYHSDVLHLFIDIYLPTVHWSTLMDYDADTDDVFPVTTVDVVFCSGADWWAILSSLGHSILHLVIWRVR
jgi:hypothetical protein